MYSLIIFWTYSIKYLLRIFLWKSRQENAWKKVKNLVVNMISKHKKKTQHIIKANALKGIITIVPNFNTHVYSNRCPSMLSQECKLGGNHLGSKKNNFLCLFFCHWRTSPSLTCYNFYLVIFLERHIKQSGILRFISIVLCKQSSANRKKKPFIERPRLWLQLKLGGRLYAYLRNSV